MNAKTKKILIGTILVILLAGVILLYLLSRRVTPIPEGTVGNTAGNLYNDGVFCEYKGKVYFANPYDEMSMYVMNADGTNVKRLIAASVSHINAGGKYLFYSQDTASGNPGIGYLRSTHSLCRSDLNGKHITSLSKDLIYNLQLVDNFLYYQTDEGNKLSFNKIKIDRTGKECLGNIQADFSCALPDGTVYYVGTETNHYLYRYDTHTGTTDTVWEGNLWYPVYDNGYIYYLDVANHYRLCRYSLSADQIEVLTNDRVDCYNLTESYIYYQKNSTNEPALIRIGKDGQNPVSLMNGNFKNISVASGYVYFVPFESGYPLYRVSDGYDYPEIFEAAATADAKARKIR